MATGISIDNIKYELSGGSIVELSVTNVDLNCGVFRGFEEKEKFEKIELTGCRITDISFLWDFVNVEWLDLTNNEIYNISTLKILRRLKDLRMTRNKISDITPLKGLIQLEELFLGFNSISQFSTLSFLKHLKVLYLEGNKITDISELRLHSSISELCLDDNLISNIESLSLMVGLEDLYLDYNKIDNVSPLSSLHKLRNLTLEGNGIIDISPLDSLINLEYLNISLNRISDIRPLNGLSLLDTLFIDENNISDLSPILDLPINSCIIYNNPFKDAIPPETIDAGWAAIKEHLKSIREEETLIPIREAKMLLLGNPNVGKSDLLSYLNHGSIPQLHQRTHGLVYEILSNICDGAKIHCWDFGGQEYFHATHQLFFSPGALHLLLWSKENVQRNSDTPERCFDVSYWLRCIEQLGMSKSEDESIETIVIENKIDLQGNTNSYINQNEYSQKFNQLRLHFISVSIAKDKRLAGLKELITERLESLFRPHPPMYREFQNVIHNNPTKEVFEISDLSNGEPLEKVRTAMEVLHNIGCLLYFPEVIENKIFTNPTTLLELLYKKVLPEHNQYKVTNIQLKKVIKDNSLGLSFEEVKKLLLHFKLMFSINGQEDMYYIPQYLPDAPSWIGFFEQHKFKKVFVRIESDGYLMNLALLQLFSRYAQYIKLGSSEPLFWRDGLVVEKNNQLLLVKFNRDMQCLDLYSDMQETNFELQKSVISFVLSLSDIKRRMVDSKTTKRGKFPNEDRTGSAELNWESEYFDVMISNDGRYFVSWKKLVENVEKGIYNVEASDDMGKKKIFSVFDFNKYLPRTTMGRMKNIFISYSKSDFSLVKKFQEHLSALKLDGKVATWYCSELTAGSEWNSEIQEHFDEADIVCFMISPNFMKTKYIHEHEINKAFRRKESDPNFLIVPIILDFCRWETKNNNLTVYTALPYSAKPVMDFKNQNMAWYIIQEALRIIIDDNTEISKERLYSHTDLPEDVKKIHERINNGEANL